MLLIHIPIARHSCLKYFGIKRIDKHFNIFPKGTIIIFFIFTDESSHVCEIRTIIVIPPPVSRVVLVVIISIILWMQERVPLSPHSHLPKNNRHLSAYLHKSMHAYIWFVSSNTRRSASQSGKLAIRRSIKHLVKYQQTKLTSDSTFELLMLACPRTIEKIRSSPTSSLDEDFPQQREDVSVPNYL